MRALSCCLLLCSLAGAVTLVADKEKVLDVETVGFADIAAHKPMAKDDLFWIASMSKSLTATALMMLVDEGKVSLDDPVEKYLPEFKEQQVEESRRMNASLERIAVALEKREVDRQAREV